MYYCILSVPELARAMYYVVPVFFSFFPRLCLLRRLGNVHVGFTGAVNGKGHAVHKCRGGRWLVLHLTLARTCRPLAAGRSNAGEWHQIHSSSSTPGRSTGGREEIEP